ncbi:MAG: hypothetical protein IIY84_02255 [Eubacterium sp.]|nr:hypothetical protein [Eubacterium sp.]
MKRKTRLYNILFPSWMFFLLPTPVMLLLAAGNFGIDSLVTLLGLRHLGVEERTPIYKRSIIKIWLFGFLSDFAGAGLTFLLMLAADRWFPDLDTFYFPGTSLLALPGILAAGALIYLLNRRFSFRGTGLTDDQVRRMARYLTIFTTPYLMMLPLYG